MLIFFVAVVAVIGGVAVCGLGVFFYVLLTSVKRMTVAVEALTTQLEPILSGGELSKALAVFGKMGGRFGDLIAAIGKQTSVLNLFHKMFMTQEAASGYQAVVDEGAGVKVDTGDSFFAAPSDEKLARQEEVEELRKAGIEIDEANMENPPDESQMIGERV